MLHFHNIWGQNIAQIVIHSLFHQRLRSNYCKNRDTFVIFSGSKYCKKRDTFVPRTLQSTPPLPSFENLQNSSFFQSNLIQKMSPLKIRKFGSSEEGFQGCPDWFSYLLSGPKFAFSPIPPTRISTRRSILGLSHGGLKDFLGANISSPG